MGVEGITITSSCVKGHLDIKKSQNQVSNTTELPCHRANIDGWYSVCITVEYRTFPKNRAYDNHCFLKHCSLLCWILWYVQPSLLAALHFGIVSLPYPHHLFLAACLYMELEGTCILMKTICHVELSSCLTTQKYLLIDILVLATIEHSMCSSC